MNTARESQITPNSSTIDINPDRSHLCSLDTRKALVIDTDSLMEQIYAQYDFKFGCNFSQHRSLKLLSFAKPLIQYSIDKLINHLCIINRATSVKAYNIDKLVDAFIPMFINQLNRVTNEILEREFAVYNGYRLGREAESQRCAFIFMMQDKYFVQQLHGKYPGLFNDMLKVSDNWLDFIVKFAGKLQANYHHQNDYKRDLLCA